MNKEYGNLHSFYLNRERVSEYLDVESNELIPIENDWQDISIVSELENGLDVIVKQPGIFPTETINNYN